MTPVYNSGIAFGINFPFIVFFKLFFSFYVLLFTFLHRKVLTKLQKISLVLILLGGFSNLIELVVFGFVTDYICIPYFSCFNIADMAVVVGSALFLIGVIKSNRVGPLI